MFSASRGGRGGVIPVRCIFWGGGMSGLYGLQTEREGVSFMCKYVLVCLLSGLFLLFGKSATPVGPPFARDRERYHRKGVASLEEDGLSWGGGDDDVGDGFGGGGEGGAGRSGGRRKVDPMEVIKISKWYVLFLSIYFSGVYDVLPKRMA